MKESVDKDFDQGFPFISFVVLLAIMFILVSI